MSGRRIRRSPAGHPVRRPREKDEGRKIQQKVMSTGAAILLAGTVLTFLLEQAVLTPKKQVQAESALPVYSAVGQRTDDVSFWPWTFYAEHAGQEPSLMPADEDSYLQELMTMLANSLLGSGNLEIDTTGAWMESYYDSRSSCQYFQDLPMIWTPENGTPQNLTLDMGFGSGSDPALTFGMALSFVVKPADKTPTEDQLEAAYRQVLLDLYFQCGAAGWLLDDATATEVISATPSPADVAGEQQQEPASQPLATEEGPLSDEALRRLQASSRMPIETLMDNISGTLAEMIASAFVVQWPAGLGPDTALWPLENSPDPVALAAGTMSEADTHKLEQRLQQQYAEYGIELQVVTLSDSVLVLFSDTGITTGFYYDPVLELWSGIAIQ